jgi:hypothetical protein
MALPEKQAFYLHAPKRQTRLRRGVDAFWGSKWRDFKDVGNTELRLFRLFRLFLLVKCACKRSWVGPRIIVLPDGASKYS